MVTSDPMPEPLYRPVRDAIDIVRCGGYRDFVAVRLGGDIDNPQDPLTASVVHVSGVRLALVRIFNRPCGCREELISYNHNLMN